MASPALSRERARGPEGIALRHRKGCPSRNGKPCTCRPAYQAQVWSARDRKPIRKTFGTLAEARRWRQEAQVAIRRQRLRAPTRITLEEAAEAWLSAAKQGVVRTRSGERYKPSALRSYEQALRAKLLPELGHLRLSAISRNAVQDLADRLVAEGGAPSTVRNAILPLRAIYRRALAREEVAFNPTLELSLPAVSARRERVARAPEAEALLGVLSERDRALWATALNAGLRRGELQALEWNDVDFERGMIRVERSWDPVAGPIAPKSRKGRRSVPLPTALRRHLLAHRLAQGRGGEGLVFGGVRGGAFDPEAALSRARKAWSKAGLEPICLHDCRHTYAALMIAAGVNAKALSTYMGHSTITVTLDRYGHLMPGSEGEAAGLLDAYLERERGGPERAQGRTAG